MIPLNPQLSGRRGYRYDAGRWDEILVPVVVHYRAPQGTPRRRLLREDHGPRYAPQLPRHGRLQPRFVKEQPLWHAGFLHAVIRMRFVVVVDLLMEPSGLM